MNHCRRNMEAHFIIAHEPSPAHHPAKRAFDNPATRQGSEASLPLQPTYYLDDEFKEGSLVQHRAAIVGAIGKQMFDPRPAVLERL